MQSIVKLGHFLQKVVCFFEVSMMGSKSSNLVFEMTSFKGFFDLFSFGVKLLEVRERKVVLSINFECLSLSEVHI